MLLVTGLGTGYLPIAPGTWASAAVAGLYILLAGGVWSDPIDLTIAMAVLAVVSGVICVVLGRFAEHRFGMKDPGRVTIDECAGQAATLLAMPAVAGWGQALIVGGAGFLAFRLFDILKPPPVHWLEKVPAGWGVLIDDLAAAVYANILCQIVLRQLL
ncbi:MAG: phosphatidylglycerophosphatase A [Planctomycetes bacterium]|nr:phosphatidylglycerophosphatase A [Planctomycetota bacterium]